MRNCCWHIFPSVQFPDYSLTSSSNLSSNIQTKELSTTLLMLFTRLRKTQLPWWIEIRTNIPSCIYYFGPFKSKKEARLSQHGYIEDLVEEKAQGITVELTKCQPQMLTIYKEFGE